MAAKARPGVLSKSSIDTGWGLIYRLNTLFNKAEDAALMGEMDKWNFVLDRIFVNLCYKGVMDIKFDSNEPNTMPTKVLAINLPKEETMVFNKFREIIRTIKYNTMLAIRRRNRVQYENYREEQYRTLMMKDIWLRKIMMERGLYLKEFDFDPSRAMWGG
jgi:hypothetical protein